MYSSRLAQLLEKLIEKRMVKIEFIIAVVLAYLIGSISSAVVTCKLMGLPDPRTEGSKNPGATNVLRIGGKKAAIITLIGDILKGVIPVLAAKAWGFGVFELSVITLAAFLGHLFPVFFRFVGGKGVATACGCWLALAWPVGVAVMVTWILVAVCFRYSSLSALVAALLGPVYAFVFTNVDYTVMGCVMSLILILRHGRNIRNLVLGKEDKINLGKKTVIGVKP
jgi:glycerol-3-phosphate acyltransferase PlsY